MAVLDFYRRASGLLLPQMYFSQPLPCPVCCNTTICPGCSGFHAPTQLQVDVAGIVNDECDACAAFNGTFILTRFTDVTCLWLFTDEEEHPCSEFATFVVSVLISSAGGGSYTLKGAVDGFGEPPNGGPQFKKEYEEEIMCNEWNNLSLPFWRNGRPFCDGTAASFHVTAL